MGFILRWARTPFPLLLSMPASTAIGDPFPSGIYAGENFSHRLISMVDARTPSFTGSVILFTPIFSISAIRSALVFMAEKDRKSRL